MNLDERYSEHRKTQNSALRIHQNQHGHPLPVNADSDNIRILDKETDWKKRKILEAMYIQANNPDLNRNVGHYELPKIYNKLINSKEGGFVV